MDNGPHSLRDDELAAGWRMVAWHCQPSLPCWCNDKSVAGRTAVLTRWHDDKSVMGRMAVLACWCNNKLAAEQMAVVAC